MTVVEEGRREALIDRALVLAVEDAIDGPPHSYGPEPMEVRDYRHLLYGIWSPLRDAILALTPVEVVGERAAIVAWLRRQSDLGANRGNEADKGTTKRAAFGGGSLALSRAADAVEAGEHRTNDNAALSTPVAQGDEVRDALERIVKRVADGEWADPGHRALMTDAREFLATLTKGARDAG